MILVEGLPGTGKTTLSKNKFYLKKGKQVELLLEGNASIPSNFHNIAGLSKKDLIKISVEIPPITETDNYTFIDLETCTKEAESLLRRYDIGDEFNKHISVREYVCCTLEWWRYWVAEKRSESILILDSAFMQCPINEMIFRGASDSEIIKYITNIFEIIKPYNPICIYLRRESVKMAINFAKSAKGEHWAKGINSLTEMGYPDFFERRFELENIVLSSVANIVCNIYGYDWSDAEEKIRML